MENHPIPQDVTGFKFKLIGSVTVKQFLYLLAFGIFATIVFVLHINFYVKLPLMIMFACIGTALAFLPIEGRPMDTMIVNFAKTIPAENRFIYKKRGVNLQSFEIFMQPRTVTPAQTVRQGEQATRDSNDDKRAILISRLRNSTFRPDEGEVRVLNNIHTYFENSGAKITAPIIPQQKEGEVTRAIQDKEKYEAIEAIRKSGEDSVPQETQIEKETAVQESAAEPQTGPPPDTLKLSQEENAPSNAEVETPVALPEKPNPTLAAGFPTLPDVPNVVLGIVRDPRGKSLPNILVEVVDLNGLPVRAFKTSALGQFASATPLQNGTYKVSFEDPTKLHEFAVVEISLSGEIFQPIEITSIDARERLRQELFGGQAATA